MDYDDDIEVEEDIQNMKSLYGKLEMLVQKKTASPPENGREEKRKRNAISQDEVRTEHEKDNKSSKKVKVIKGKNTKNINLNTIDNIQTNHVTLETLNYFTESNKEKVKAKGPEKKHKHVDSSDGLYQRSLKTREKASKKREDKKNHDIEKELAALQTVPSINENSKNMLMKKNGEKGFFERLEINKQETEKKKLMKLKEQEEKVKKEQEEIEAKKVKLDKNQIKDKLDKLYDWNDKKEKKLKLQKDKMEKEVDTLCTFKPEINKTSEKIVTNNISDFVDKTCSARLYEIDVAKRKERQKKLENIYSHPFAPVTNNFAKDNSTNEKGSNLNKTGKVNEDNPLSKTQTHQNDEEINMQK